MSLPELADSGELPLGVHPASLHETLARFGLGSLQRVAVGERLERVYRVAAATDQLSRFVVFGSFVTDTPEPNDVDVVLVVLKWTCPFSVPFSVRDLRFHFGAECH